MSKLYIIGNGFDLHFHLPTSTENFKEILAKRYLSRNISALDFFESYGVNWSDFEKGLSEFDLDEFIYENTKFPDYLSDHEYDRDGTITDMEYYITEMRKAIDDSFLEMVEKANEELSSKLITLFDIELIEKDNPIISFNYTSTVERLYGFDCFHIHGFFENDEYLIYGYNKPQEFNTEHELSSKELEHDYYVDRQKELALNFYYSLMKKFQWDKLNEYLSNTIGIETIVVLGHSLGEVDKEYFEHIENKLKPLKWIIYYHDDIPSFNEYSFSDKVILKKW